MTTRDATVLLAVREASRGRSGEPVPVELIKEHARDLGVSYDAVDRGLRALVAAGLVERPRRGHYLLTDKATG